MLYKAMTALCAIVTAAMWGCSRDPDPAPAHVPQVAIPISVLSKPYGLQHIDYSGHWQFVRGRLDGRYGGASARSYHSDDSVSIFFRGTRLRIYGVTGKNGGRADLLIAGLQPKSVSFYDAAAKRTHRLVYDSRSTLPNGVHVASLVVVPSGAHKTGYVNIDEFEIWR